MKREHVYALLALASGFSGPRWARSGRGPKWQSGPSLAERERERKEKQNLRKVRDVERLRAKIEKNRRKRERTAERKRLSANG